MNPAAPVTRCLIKKWLLECDCGRTLRRRPGPSFHRYPFPAQLLRAPGLHPHLHCQHRAVELLPDHLTVAVELPQPLAVGRIEQHPDHRSERLGPATERRLEWQESVGSHRGGEYCIWPEFVRPGREGGGVLEGIELVEHHQLGAIGEAEVI